MATEPAQSAPPWDEGRQGSILLPVILLLLLLATAATAMTLQARTSLRDAATRRDRLALAAVADGAVRATALALAAAAASQAAPPFALDGTPQMCRLDGRRRLVLAVQDEGGLVDLNKAGAELITLVLGRAGLSAPDAEGLAEAITAHRTDAPRPKLGKQPVRSRPGDVGAAEAKDFTLADEIGDLPGVDTRLFGTVRPLFTASNRSAGIDPAVAAPALRALIPPKELTSPKFEAMTTPSSHTDFTITADVTGATHQSFIRRGLFRMDPQAGATGRFTAWDALPMAPPWAEAGLTPFCEKLAAALAIR